MITCTRLRHLIPILLICTVSGCAALPGTSVSSAQGPANPAAYVRSHFTKREFQIPMRDGVKLYTAVYTPKNASEKHRYPMLMKRTPYSIGPYGEDAYPDSLGPSALFLNQGYIFVNQDVRGCYMSEGTLNNMTPHIDHKQSPSDIDESSDTYDTIEFLLKNVPHHNGRVGQWGISYPGFYSSAGMIDAHPALKAVSPQAPIADWYFDDFFHHGAFFLPHSFNFMSGFGRPRPAPVKDRHWGFEHGTPDGYQFFLDLGPLRNANEKYFHHEIAFWDEMAAHPNYVEFWQSRNILPHLKNVAPAVMTVGGWFDAEDLYGALQTYRAVETQNPGIFNMIVMGPWVHGGWARTDGDRLGAVTFDAKTSLFYRENIELAFFNHHLKDGPDPDLPEAYMFETGANRWRMFDQWPPQAQRRSLYCQDGGALSSNPPAGNDHSLACDEFISDPAKPVPYTQAIAIGMTREYMTDDQRFASRRTDVLTYRTEVLQDDLTMTGPLLADLWVSTSGSDSDWIVKVIDVFPNDFKSSAAAGATASAPARPRNLAGASRRSSRSIGETPMGGYQMMVRSEVIRGRFRNSYEKPEPFVPDQPTHVKLPLQDVLHTFKKGHRVMVQFQSTWFPLVDRNPQKYVDNIFEADEADFVKTTQRVYRSTEHSTRLEFGVLEN